MARKRGARGRFTRTAPTIIAGERACKSCGELGGRERCGFRAQPSAPNVPRGDCRRCETDKKRVADRARSAARRASDYAALKPEDFDVGVANDGRSDPNASSERRQEYSEAMGETADALRASGGDPATMPGDVGEYVARLAEQERRFGNRRIARSASLAAAHEALAVRQFKAAAEEYLRGACPAPEGYALREHRAIKRTVVLLLSDLHLGSDLGARDNPIQFGAVEEARRLEYVVRQALDYKPQYRDTSEALLLLNGDLIEGYLLHDLRDGAPLTEQKVVFWRAFRTIVWLLSTHFPKVRVVCQPGNHGRDRVRHPGRATSSKWDGHEWQMYWALREMCAELRNVEWDIPQRSVAIVDLYGSKLLLTHGDTEILLGDPDTKAEKNSLVLDRINSTGIYGCEFDAAAFGHYHKPRYIPKRIHMLWNGALVPPNGYARGQGWISEPCGQWLWEAVEGYPVGDLRFVEVGQAQDRDEQLGKLIPPFRFAEESSA